MLRKETDLVKTAGDSNFPHFAFKLNRACPLSHKITNSMSQKMSICVDIKVSFRKHLKRSKQFYCFYVENFHLSIR